jgi:hypothetical protein
MIRVGRAVGGPDGDFFIPDGRGKRVLWFAGDGRLLRELRIGRDLKVSALGTIATDTHDNLMVHDLGEGWITVTAKPDFREVRRFRLTGAVSDFLAVDGDAVVTYYPSSKDGAFRLFDQNGSQLRQTVPMHNDNLRIFHGRVQNGGITRDAGGALFAVLPSPFELVRLSPELKALEVYTRPERDEWMPDAPAFPDGLSPYDYRPAHTRWWDSFRHVGRPFALAPGVVLVTVFDSHGLSQIKDFANLFDINGHIIAKGLEVPHDGQIVGARDGRVYVARNAHLVAGDTIAPLEFYVYQLRKPIVVGARGSSSPPKS